MNYSFTIQGRLESLNAFISANRTHPKKGNRMKRLSQNLVECFIFKDIPKVRIDKPIRINYRFFEPNKKRDLDNVSGYAHKIIQDALVETGVLHNDTWDYIVGFTDEFFVDNANPRIEVILEEVK